MSRTYTAVISPDRVRWLGGAPDVVRDGGSVIAEVTVRGATAPPPVPGISGARLVEILDELADLGSFEGIGDPVEWQRQQREDRFLEGEGS